MRWIERVITVVIGIVIWPLIIALAIWIALHLFDGWGGPNPDLHPTIESEY